MFRSGIMLICLCHTLCLGPAAAGGSGDGADLRLVPFPKHVELGEGKFLLGEQMTLCVPAHAAPVIYDRLKRELQLAKIPVWKFTTTTDNTLCFRIFFNENQEPPQQFAGDAHESSYVLEVNEHEICCHAADASGLFYGAETLCQLIRANRIDGGLPCLSIRDWPSLKWRCFQDDMTRGPSSTLKTLQQHIDLVAELKMNLFTYYMEYQYAFQKHPLIGPKDGSLLPDELKTLVHYAQAKHLDILGNQQSFGHFTWILKHPEYAALRETDYLLCPTREETYQLLDDLYSEVCPLLPFPMFNVCCDETAGLGSGPSKPLAEDIGVGGVYVRRRPRPCPRSAA